MNFEDTALPMQSGDQLGISVSKIGPDDNVEAVDDAVSSLLREASLS